MLHLHQSWLKLVIMSQAEMIPHLSKLVQNMTFETLISLVVSILNSLPNRVVLFCYMTSTFRNRIDRFWENQEILYNFKAQLEGTGSRSNVQS